MVDVKNSPMHLTDSDILIMFRNPASRETGFQKLVETTQEKLFHLIFRMVGHTADTADVMQDVYLKAYLHLDQFAGKSSLYTWLYRIAVNECLDFLERRDRRTALRVLPDPDKEISPTQEAIWHDLLQAAMDQLPTRQRLVFALRYCEQMSYADMERMLDTSQGALKASFHHAVSKLKLYFQEMDNAKPNG